MRLHFSSDRPSSVRVSAVIIFHEIGELVAQARRVPAFGGPSLDVGTTIPALSQQTKRVAKERYYAEAQE